MKKTLISVARYIKHSIDEGKRDHRKPRVAWMGLTEQWHQRQLTQFKWLLMGVLQLDSNVKALNKFYRVNLESCMTRQVESLHATHHLKHEAGAHVLDYAWSFGNTVKEGLKRTTTWAAHYFTNKKSYYPIPTNVVSFGTFHYCHH